MTREISRKDAVYYANATAAKDLASVSNVEISNIRITNVDPRYPILLEGLVDSKVKNVILRNISVQYRAACPSRRLWNSGSWAPTGSTPRAALPPPCRNCPGW